METVALESDGKQVERSRNGTKRLKIVQKAFSHFFVFSAVISEGEPLQKPCGKAAESYVHPRGDPYFFLLSLSIPGK